MKNCAQASAKGGIIQKFEFRHLIYEASKAVNQASYSVESLEHHRSKVKILVFEKFS